MSSELPDRSVALERGELLISTLPDSCRAREEFDPASEEASSELSERSKQQGKSYWKYSDR